MAKKSTGKKKSGSIWRWIFAVLFIGAAFTDGFTFGCLVIGLALLAPEIIAAIMVFAGRKSAEKKPQIQNTPVSAPVEPKPSLVKYNSCSRIIQDDYVILDVETTGLSPESDRVIELAVVKVESGQVVDTFASLVNPERAIPENVVKLTNITQDMVADAPVFSALAEAIVSFIGDLPVVAHNASFDAGFLAEELNRAGVPFQFQYIDSIRLAKKAYPDMPNYKLKTLIKKLSLADHAQQHRAADDAMCTQRLYELCKQEIAHPSEKRPVASSAEPVPGYAENQDGMLHEAKDEIEEAIACYEESIAKGFTGSAPYERLAILYRKQKRYDDEIRVCNAMLAILGDNPDNQSKAIQFHHRITAASQKIQRANENDVS